MLKKNESSQSPFKKLSRKISDLTRLHLFVAAGGRCEFCNENVMMHNLTQTKGVFAEMAHIVAFKEKGPRGNDGERPEDINDISNLMLLCPSCHKFIDDNWRDYSRKTLEHIKEAHEIRIKTVTEIGPEKRSAVLVFTSPIRGQEVSVRKDHIRQAMFPRYPISSKGTHIDLTGLKGSEETHDFLKTAKALIKRKISLLFDTDGEVEKAQHLSIFGIGPMVQLMILGAELSNKVPASLYQRHRDTEDWTWKTEGRLVTYKLTKIKTGGPTAPIVLTLALSGTIPIENLPDAYKENASIYQISLDEQTPNTMFLNQKADLEAFKAIYSKTLGLISAEHGLLETISVFSAVPAPIAIMCGRERLPKVHPKLRVYDFDHANGGFKFQSIVGD
ncbi:MAG: HNH endonuclease [Proteobacteria bacterium]|nr:HNH endonuclease [Pseudomonadota bacterium]